MAISQVAAVQSTGLSATFATAPAQGDLLIAVNSNQASDAGVAAGWTQLDVLNASIWDVVTAWKICGAGESTTQTPFTGTSGNVSIAQFHSTNGFPVNPINVHNIAQAAGNGTPPTITSASLTPTQSANALFVQCYANSASDPAPASITGMTSMLSLSGGTTGTGANFYQIGIGTSAFTKTATWTGSTAARPMITCIVFYENSGSTPKSLSASLSFSGSVQRGIARPLAGGVSFGGSAQRGIVRPLTAALSFSGTAKRSTARALAGALSFSGALARSTSRALTGTLSFSGSTARTIARPLAASLSFAGTVKRGTTRPLTAALGFAGTVKRAVTYKLAGTLSFNGSINTGNQFFKTLTAALSFTGSTARRIGRTLGGSISFSGNAKRSVAVTLRASLGLSAAAPRNAIARAFAAVLSFVGVLTPSQGGSTTKALTGTLAFHGALTMVVYSNTVKLEGEEGPYYKLGGMYFNPLPPPH